MTRYAIGVDVGGTTVKLGLFSADSTLLEKREIPTNIQEYGTRILPDVVASITEMITKKGIDVSQVIGIGFGFPGPVNSAGVVSHCDNLNSGPLDVKSELARLMPEITNIKVENDANAAALGELLHGGGKGYTSAFMITLGTGVGGGVVLNNRIVSGFNGAAGEVGHFTVEPQETDLCGCGKRGCLEQYASANGMVRLARRMLAQCQTISPLRAMDVFTAKDICDLARASDPLASSVLNRCADYLGLALSYISCIIDPQVFIVGGGMSRAGSVLIDSITDHYRRYAYHAAKQTAIVEAKLGNDAGIYGCAAMVLS